MSVQSERSGERFREWPLHDAVIERLELDWATRTLRLDLLVFFDAGQEARPARIEWRGVRTLNVPFEQPWGLGGHTFVNDSWKEGGGAFVIEPQSGDDIRVVAVSATLIETSYAHPRDR